MNKQSIITILLTMLMSMTGAKAFAHDIEAKNADNVTIYYVWINNNTELSVNYRGSSYSSYSNEYTGNVVIPKSVTYNGNTYPVTSIYGSAFRSCSSLQKLELPSTLDSIGNEAFTYTNSLSSVISRIQNPFGISQSVFCLGWDWDYSTGEEKQIFRKD